MKRLLLSALLVIFFSAYIAPQAEAGWNPFASKEKGEGAKEELLPEEETAEALANFRDNYPGLKKFFDTAYGYAVFPSVGKAGIFVGGSRGKGDVYEQGVFVGKSTLTQITVGLQLGGQIYSEIIFFKRKRVIEDFKEGRFTLGAQASAVALRSGVSSDARYSRGVAVFTAAKGGLMYEASVGGQRFTFEAVEK